MKREGERARNQMKDQNLREERCYEEIEQG